MKEVNIFELPELTEAEVVAIKACWVGEATSHQQRQAMNVVVDKLSMADRLPYQVGSFDQTAFLNGRAWVGKALRRILKRKSQ